MNNDDKYDALLKLVHEAKLESIALQSVCSILIAEMAIISGTPTASMDRIVTSFRGLAHGLAMGANEPHLTATMENVCAMAEDVLQDQKPR